MKLKRPPRKIWNALHPCFRARSVTDVTAEFLKHQGIKAVILDLDGNLIGYRDQHVAPEVQQWLKSLATAKFKICILTNPSRNSSYQAIADITKLPTFRGRYPKPFSPAFHRAQKHLAVPFSDIAMIGDQLFTDILGGNWVGALTIWTDNRPGVREGWLTRKVNRRLERWYTKLFPNPAPYITPE